MRSIAALMGFILVAASVCLIGSRAAPLSLLSNAKYSNPLEYHPASSFFTSALSGLNDVKVPDDNAIPGGVGAANPALAAGEEADVDPQDELEEAQKSVEEAKERVLDDAKRLRDIAQAIKDEKASQDKNIPKPAAAVKPQTAVVKPNDGGQHQFALPPGSGLSASSSPAQSPRYSEVAKMVEQMVAQRKAAVSRARAALPPPPAAAFRAAPRRAAMARREARPPHRFQRAAGQAMQQQHQQEQHQEQHQEQLEQEPQHKRQEQPQQLPEQQPQQLPEQQQPVSVSSSVVPAVGGDGAVNMNIKVNVEAPPGLSPADRARLEAEERREVNMNIVVNVRSPEEWARARARARRANLRALPPRTGHAAPADHHHDTVRGGAARRGAGEPAGRRAGAARRGAVWASRALGRPRFDSDGDALPAGRR